MALYGLLSDRLSSGAVRIAAGQAVKSLWCYSVGIGRNCYKKSRRKFRGKFPDKPAPRYDTYFMSKGSGFEKEVNFRQIRVE